MKSGYSMTRVTGRRSLSRPIRVFAVFITILAAFFGSAVILTLVAANRLMRLPPEPLDTYSSNILPDFSLVTFPSLDEQNTLEGWFFQADNPVSTIILVHGQNKNRLQFGLDSAYLFENLVAQSYNILAFDLRNSGESGGQMSGYGYAEWADVLAAIRYVKKHATTRNVLLYGFGTGVTAVLLATEKLPPPGLLIGKSAEDIQVVLAGYPLTIQNLDFDQSYICGLLLDTPCESPDAYIRAECRERLGWLGEHLLQYTVPYAIRLSAGSDRANLVTILTRQHMPVFIAYSRTDNTIGTAAVLPLVEEQCRLHPETTVVFAGVRPGSTDGFLLEQDDYLSALHSFLARFFASKS